MASSKATDAKRPDPDANDAVDEFFQCEVQCPVNDNSCHDECVDQLKEDDTQ